jgi:hypothetical protein
MTYRKGLTDVALVTVFIALVGKLTYPSIQSE